MYVVVKMSYPKREALPTFAKQSLKGSRMRFSLPCYVRYWHWQHLALAVHGGGGVDNSNDLPPTVTSEYVC